MKRQQASMRVHGEVFTSAECTAHSGQCQPYLLRRQTQDRADLPLINMEPLRSDIEVDAALAIRHRQS